MGFMKRPRKSVGERALAATPTEQVKNQLDQKSFGQIMGNTFAGQWLPDGETADEVRSKAGSTSSFLGMVDDTATAVRTGEAFKPLSEVSRSGGPTSLGILGSALSAYNLHEEIEDLEARNELTTYFDMLNHGVGVVGPWIPGCIGKAMSAYTGGVAVGEALDSASGAVAQTVAGPDGDTRSMSDRLADRGFGVREGIREGTDGLLGEQRAEKLANLGGGAFTLWQMGTPLPKIDFVDSLTGGKITNMVDKRRTIGDRIGGEVD